MAARFLTSWPCQDACGTIETDERVVADLLALCDEGDVFYLCHTADAEPTLLIIANDHTELLNK